MGKSIPLETARWRLSLVWWFGAAVACSVLIAQSLGGIYGPDPTPAWEWALPNILPTLSLILSVFALNAVGTPSEEARVRVGASFLTLAMVLSAFYVAVLATMLCVAPFTAAGTAEAPTSPLDTLRLSNLWLGPMQGLAAAAVGALFSSRSKDAGARASGAVEADHVREPAPPKPSLSN